MRLEKIFLLVCFFLLTGFLYAKEVTVGAKFFTEQFILGEITSQYLEKNGFKVIKKEGLGSNLLRKAIEEKQVDVCWEYTGTAFVAYNKQKIDGLTPKKLFKKLKVMDAKKNLIWLKLSKVNNTFAIAVRSDSKLNTLSDFAKLYKRKKPIKFAATAEFIGRNDGLRNFQKHYKFRIPRKYLKAMEAGLQHTALMNGSVDAALVFATDGQIAKFKLKVLKDDKSFFPDYTLGPVVRREVLKKYPVLDKLLSRLASLLNDNNMQQMNAAVDIDKRKIADVAKDFLTKNRL